MATKEPPVINTVTMTDGRIVEFAGKRRMLKSHSVEQDKVVVKLDFVNGETRTFSLPPELLLKFAGHGAEQKLGDEVAGVEDVDDAVEVIDELILRLEKGEWTVARKTSGGSGLSGASILVRALVELTGKPANVIREMLSTKSQEEKMALRRNSKLLPIVHRLEAEKNAKKEKKSGVDSDALLDSLSAPAADPSMLGTSGGDANTEYDEQAA